MSGTVSVLFDARVRERDGIGRVTNQLGAALEGRVDISPLERTESDLYNPEAVERPALAARQRGSRILQLLDFRVPVGDPGIPMVATVHDVFRIIDPGLCYADRDFAARYGEDGLNGLIASVRRLRDVTDLPRLPPALCDVGVQAAHWEFLARMLVLCCARSALILTPTAVVADEIRALADCGRKVRVLPWGVDHSMPPSSPSPAATRPYLVYVGQSRRHKGIDDLIVAYRASGARDAGVPLLFVGNDFRDGSPAARRVLSELGAAARPMGAVTDAKLRRIVAGARGLVHLAECEGFGFTPLEALRVGTSVIVRDLAVLRETLGVSGTFVSSPADAARAIDALIARPADAERVERARRWTARFTWSRCAGELHGLYQELAA